MQSVHYNDASVSQMFLYHLRWPVLLTYQKCVKFTWHELKLYLEAKPNLDEVTNTVGRISQMRMKHWNGRGCNVLSGTSNSTLLQLGHCSCCCYTSCPLLPLLLLLLLLLLLPWCCHCFKRKSNFLPFFLHLDIPSLSHDLAQMDCVPFKSLFAPTFLKIIANSHQSHYSQYSHYSQCLL